MTGARLLITVENSGRAPRRFEIATILARARIALPPDVGHTGPGGAACGETSCDPPGTPLDLSAALSVHGEGVGGLPGLEQRSR